MDGRGRRRSAHETQNILIVAADFNRRRAHSTFSIYTVSVIAIECALSTMAIKCGCDLHLSRRALTTGKVARREQKPG